MPYAIGVKEIKKIEGSCKLPYISPYLGFMENSGSLSDVKKAINSELYEYLF